MLFFRIVPWERSFPCGQPASHLIDYNRFTLSFLEIPLDSACACCPFSSAPFASEAMETVRRLCPVSSRHVEINRRGLIVKSHIHFRKEQMFSSSSIPSSHISSSFSCACNVMIIVRFFLKPASLPMQIISIRPN